MTIPSNKPCVSQLVQWRPLLARAMSVPRLPRLLLIQIQSNLQGWQRTRSSSFHATKCSVSARKRQRRREAGLASFRSRCKIRVQKEGWGFFQNPTHKLYSLTFRLCQTWKRLVSPSVLQPKHGRSASSCSKTTGRRLMMAF